MKYQQHTQKFSMLSNSIPMYSSKQLPCTERLCVLLAFLLYQPSLKFQVLMIFGNLVIQKAEGLLTFLPLDYCLILHNSEELLGSQPAF